MMTLTGGSAGQCKVQLLQYERNVLYWEKGWRGAHKSGDHDCPAIRKITENDSFQKV